MEIEQREMVARHLTKRIMSFADTTDTNTRRGTSYAQIFLRKKEDGFSIRIITTPPEKTILAGVIKSPPPPTD